MNAILFIKISNVINYFFTSIVLFLVKLGSRKENEKTLLLIRLDAIGDYVLFRNFIEILGNSDKYKTYKITLCGNIIWKNLAETFDKNLVSNFIWIDRKKFYRNVFYKYQLLKYIYSSGFEIVIEATHSREILYGDTIVNASVAKTSIGSMGSGEKSTVWKRKLLTNKLYTQLIKISNEHMFEFETNKELFGKILGEQIKITKPNLNTSSIHVNDSVKSKYILLFPGASVRNRMWPIKKFKDVADFVLRNYSLDIVLSGSKQELYLFDEIVSDNYKSRFINLFGNTLSELAKLIACAELLISNDTSAVHFAAAVETPFICVSNGSYFGRFNPYPKSIYEHAYHVYPSGIRNYLDNFDLLKQKYRFGSDIDIKEIESQIVIEIVENILK